MSLPRRIPDPRPSPSPSSPPSPTPKTRRIAPSIAPTILVMSTASNLDEGDVGGGLLRGGGGGDGGVCGGEGGGAEGGQAAGGDQDAAQVWGLAGGRGGGGEGVAGGGAGDERGAGHDAHRGHGVAAPERHPPHRRLRRRARRAPRPGALRRRRALRPHRAAAPLLRARRRVRGAPGRRGPRRPPPRADRAPRPQARELPLLPPARRLPAPAHGLRPQLHPKPHPPRRRHLRLHRLRRPRAAQLLGRHTRQRHVVPRRHPLHPPLRISAIPCQDQPRKADANPIGDHSSHSSWCVSSFALLAHCIVEKVANHGVQGAYTMDEDSWRGISSEAKELIRSLLAVNPATRPSANEVLAHPWVSGDTASRELLHEDIFMRFQAFNARRKFRATVYASIVRTKFQLRTKYLKEIIGDRVLTESELEDLRVNFIRISSNGKTATLEEFQEVLCSMKLQCLVPIAPRIFKLFDYNHDGWIDLREVICGFTALLRTAHEEDKMRLCFKMYDTDDSGYISKHELALVLGALPEDYLPTDISKLKMDEIFEHIDTDSDGRISYEEFRNALSLQDVIMTSFRAAES